MDLIPGLTFSPNYLDASTQSELTAIIDQQIWITDIKRRVQHYGYRYDYRARKVDPSMYLGLLPDWAARLAERLHNDGLTPQTPDQLIVNEYIPGQGIAPHVDCVPCFDDTIISLSLGSPCIMMFSHLHSRREIPLLLEPGSVLVMQGEARYDWKHGIPARLIDQYEGRTITRTRRLSLTFRNIIAELRQVG